MNVSAYKLGSSLNSTLTGHPAGPDQEHTYSRLFTREKTTGPDRLKVGADRDTIKLLIDFIACVSPPLSVLYILRVSRTGAEPARYESPLLDYNDVVDFIWTFGEFFQRDARHDVWVSSANTSGLLVLDSHALLFAYGPLDRYTAVLHENGYKEGIVEIPAPHTHHYHVEFDQDEEQVLRYFDWAKRPLGPDDQD